MSSWFIRCELCGSLNKDERAIFEQNDHMLCHQCYGLYDNDELEEELKKWEE